MVRVPAELARRDPQRLAEAVGLRYVEAGELGNTRAVARSSYVHPRVKEAPEAEITHVWKRSRRSSWRSRGDSALAKLLGRE